MISKSQNRRINIQKGRDINAVLDKVLKEWIDESRKNMGECQYYNDAHLIGLELKSLRSKYKDLRVYSALQETDLDNIEGVLLGNDRTIRELSEQNQELILSNKRLAGIINCDKILKEKPKWRFIKVELEKHDKLIEQIEGKNKEK